MMRCHRVQPQLLDFSCGRLEPPSARAIALHLDRCDDCRRLLERETRTASLLARVPPVSPREDTWPAVAAALRGSSAAVGGRSSFRRPLIWAGGLAAASALAWGLIAPTPRTAAPTLEPESLRHLAPAVAAGLIPERASDPLVALQQNTDRLLDQVTEEPS
jgi:anti-sigma factor ChrR (cupin superfamily)